MDGVARGYSFGSINTSIGSRSIQAYSKFLSDDMLFCGSPIRYDYISLWSSHWDGSLRGLEALFRLVAVLASALSLVRNWMGKDTILSSVARADERDHDATEPFCVVLGSS